MLPPFRCIATRDGPALVYPHKEQDASMVARSKCRELPSSTPQIERHRSSAMHQTTKDQPFDRNTALPSLINAHVYQPSCVSLKTNNIPDNFSNIIASPPQPGDQTAIILRQNETKRFQIAFLRDASRQRGRDGTLGSHEGCRQLLPRKLGHLRHRVPGRASTKNKHMFGPSWLSER